MDNRYNRVHKETSGISQLIGIRQFLMTDRDHGIPHSLQRYLWIFSQFLFQIAVIDRKPRLFAQTYIYISNNVRVVMLILEETIPITIKTFFICKHTFLERKLVICLHRLDHILDFRTVCPDILDSSCSDFARNAGQIFYPSPTFGDGISDYIVPLLGSSNAKQYRIVCLFRNRDTFYLRMQDNPVKIIYKQQITATSDMQRQTFLKIFVPEDPPQFFFIRIFHKPTGLHRKVKSIMFLQRVILFYSHFAYVLFCRTKVTINIKSISRYIKKPFKYSDQRLFNIFCFANRNKCIYVLLNKK